MIEQYPVTPPPELVAQIRSDALRKSSDVLDYELRMIHAAYRAGADQELEACYEWAAEVDRDLDKELRAARRPTPSSLKERLKVALWNEDLGTALRLVEQIDD